MRSPKRVADRHANEAAQDTVPHLHWPERHAVPPERELLLSRGEALSATPLAQPANGFARQPRIDIPAPNSSSEATDITSGKPRSRNRSLSTSSAQRSPISGTRMMYSASESSSISIP